MSSRVLFSGNLSGPQAEQLVRYFRAFLDTQHPRPVGKPPLLCVLPFARHESGKIKELLLWMRELGGSTQHPCLLAADCRFDAAELPTVIELAKRCFRSVDFVQTPHALPDERWPHGPNWLFEITAKHVAARHKLPFFWCEPDCIPLQSGWLEKLEAAYYGLGKPFMGAVVEPSEAHPVERHLNGCAVYPCNAIEYLAPFLCSGQAWDWASRERVLPHAVNSALIQSEWIVDGKPPTFRHAGDLRRLHPLAVVYHRNKDGSLIRWLKQRRRLEHLTTP